jgi:hypothetical protein
VLHAALALNVLQKLDVLDRPLPLVLVLLAATIIVAYVWLRRRRRRPRTAPPPEIIDLADWPIEPLPDGESPVLECFNLPMRLVVLVLAPLGRGRELPAEGSIVRLSEMLLPGLPEVLRLHNTRVITWPAQLSSQGFSHAFFGRVRLPGDHGRGTPWCSLAGKLNVDGQMVMVGMALHAESANRLSKVVVESEFEWLKLIALRRNR